MACASRLPRSRFPATLSVGPLRPPASASTAHADDMAAIHPSRLLRPSLALVQQDTVLAFLVPSVQFARFSTSPARWKRDNNKNRGNSAVRATGLRPRQTLSVKEKDFSKQKLPKPVKIEQEVTGTPDHGLWDFFQDQKLLQTPVQEQRHGRLLPLGP
jgi:large subunit ribosomal protein L47